MILAPPSQSASPTASMDLLDRDEDALWDDVVESSQKEVMERVEFGMSK